MQADRDTGWLSKSSAFESVLLAPFPAPLAPRSRHFHLLTIVMFISMSSKVYHWGVSFISLGDLSVDSTEAVLFFSMSLQKPTFRYHNGLIPER